MTKLLMLPKYALLSVLLLSAGCNGLMSRTPAEVAKAFLEAANEADYSKAERLLYKTGGIGLGLDIEQACNLLTGNGSLAKMEVLSENVRGEDATVTFRLEYTTGEVVEDLELPLRKLEGSWKVTVAALSGTSADISTVDATQITIESERVIDKTYANKFSLTLSTDGKRIFYARRDSKQLQELIVFDLATERIVSTIPLEHTSPVTGIAWSPDESRIAYCVTVKGKWNSRTLVILNVQTNKSIPLHGKCLSNLKILLWPNESEVYFVQGIPRRYKAVRLNLDTLEYDSFRNKPDEREKFFADYLNPETASTHPSAYLSVGPGLIYSKVNFDVINKDGLFSRSLFGGVSPTYDEIVTTPDLRFIVYHKWRSNKDIQELVLMRLGTRERPVMEFQISAEPILQTASRSGWDRDRMREVREIFGDVYGPEFNPLNGKVVGPDESLYRGKVRVVAIHNKGLRLRTYYEKELIRAGDIVKPIGFRSERRGHGHNLIKEWAVLLSNGSIDVGALVDFDAFDKNAGNEDN